MQETTIYTKDTKNNCAYSTTDTLYPAYGADRGNYDYITVGKNTSDDLNSGLRIDKAYWGSQDWSGETFWLRTPNADNTASVQTAGVSASSWGVNDGSAVMPAFELNLSSVLFASVAEAASSTIINGTIGDGAAMTLRLDGKDKTIGTASYDAAAGRIVAQKDAGTAGTVSLVVQGRGELKTGITACR